MTNFPEVSNIWYERIFSFDKILKISLETLVTLTELPIVDSAVAKVIQLKEATQPAPVNHASEVNLTVIAPVECVDWNGPGMVVPLNDEPFANRGDAIEGPS